MLKELIDACLAIVRNDLKKIAAERDAALEAAARDRAEKDEAIASLEQLKAELEALKTSFQASGNQ